MERATNEQSCDMIQLHPYQYLTQLNSIYSTCNKANSKSYSSVSKIKLAWKPFSLIKIPKCFETTYKRSHLDEKQNKNENNQAIDESEKKIWKDHQEILKRYSKKQERTKFSYRPHTSTGRRFLNNTSEQNDTKISFDQTSLLLKRMQDKGVKVQYDKEDVKNQVIQKLKKINNQTAKKSAWRAQSATNNIRKETDTRVNEENIKEKGQYYFNQKPYLGKQRKNIDQNEYLLYQKGSEIIESYKAKIKQVDCAISEKNIRKTAQILRNMQNIVQNLDQ